MARDSVTLMLCVITRLSPVIQVKLIRVIIPLFGFCGLAFTDRYLSRTGDAPEWSMSVCCRTYDLPCGLLLPFGIGYRPFKTDRKHDRHSLVRRKLVEQRGKIRMENHPSPASHPSCKNGQTAGQSDRNCTISRMEFSCRNFFRFLQKAEEA